MYMMLGAIAIDTAANAVLAVASTGADLTTTDLIKNIVDVGITPVLLVVFILYFISKSKNDDARVAAAYAESQKKISETNNIIAQREKQLQEESTRREELIRQEAEKRETLIRKESEKRESILMGNMERMVQSMDDITRTMKTIDQSFAKVNERLEKIEGKINEGFNDGGKRS